MIFKESTLRPIISLSHNVSLYIHLSACLSVPFSCHLFQGLSFALRSHDQIKASHWLPPPHSEGAGYHKFLHFLSIKEQ